MCREMFWDVQLFKSTARWSLASARLPCSAIYVPKYLDCKWLTQTIPKLQHPKREET